MKLHLSILLLVLAMSCGNSEVPDNPEELIGQWQCVLSVSNGENLLSGDVAPILFTQNKFYRYDGSEGVSWTINGDKLKIENDPIAKQYIIQNDTMTWQEYSGEDILINHKFIRIQTTTSNK
ncbi:MAG: hypothetical protein QNK23_16255 [Crocinitomicaceae bacterium]|nr:hypothetical protein [Crocinitomicaceae bacterium]